MKKTITLTFACVTILTAMSFDVLTGNGKAGATGSPGEKSCVGCHNTYGLNSGTGSLTIQSAALVNWKYEPDKTYTINVTVTNPGTSLFGIGFEALTAAGANAGTLVPGTTTKISNATVSGNQRTSITHTGSGNTGTDSFVFTFTWQSPSTDVGDVTFYCAGNAANGNKTTAGDYIYAVSQVVKSPSSVGIPEQEVFGKHIRIFPNPATDHLQLVNTLNALEPMQIKILDAKGSLIRQQQNIRSNERIELNDINAGFYTLQVETAGRITSKLFIKK